MSTFGRRKQLEARAHHAVELDREPGALRRARAERAARPAARSRAPSAASLAANARARSAPDDAECLARRRQTPVGVVGPQRQPIFGARGEHAIGLADALRGQVVDQHADIGVGAVERPAARAGRPPARR